MMTSAQVISEADGRRFSPPHCLSTTVLVPSFKRNDRLIRCLASLHAQSMPPNEVLVIWQGDDYDTQRTVDEWRDRVCYSLRSIHSPTAGIVPAENCGLAEAGGDIIFLIDDDATAPPQWIENHLRHYSNSRVGAVGGPIRNYSPDGRRAMERDAMPIGRLRWYGKFIGNGFDHVSSWRLRAPIPVDHIAGSNVSARRSAFSRFEQNLRPYWQCFEADFSLQVKSNNYRILFDFANHVDHWPSGSVYVAGRQGDLNLKVINAAFNDAFVLSKHTSVWLRWIRLSYLILLGTPSVPGLLCIPLAMLRFGNPSAELRLGAATIRARWGGWRAGARRRNWKSKDL
jgi:glycosyltransferase involved in cell wall biosynthesis